MLSLVAWDCSAVKLCMSISVQIAHCHEKQAERVSCQRCKEVRARACNVYVQEHIFCQGKLIEKVESQRGVERLRAFMQSDAIVYSLWLLRITCTLQCSNSTVRTHRSPELWRQGWFWEMASIVAGQLTSESIEVRLQSLCAIVNEAVFLPWSHGWVVRILSQFLPCFCLLLL